MTKLRENYVGKCDPVSSDVCLNMRCGRTFQQKTNCLVIWITRIESSPRYTLKPKAGRSGSVPSKVLHVAGGYMLRNRSLSLFAVLVLSFAVVGCSSGDEPAEPEVSYDSPQDPEQVSFADWNKPENCELGTMPVIGEAECQRVGSECPADDWPAAIPEGSQVIYVQPGAEGDGSSKTSALGKISDAVELAEDGAVVVLSKGTHLDNVVIEKSLTMIGACPTETIVEGKVGMGTNISGTLTTHQHEAVNEAGDYIAVLFLRGQANVNLQDFQLRGDNVGLLATATGPSELGLQGLIFNSLEDSALLIQGEAINLDADSLSIENTRYRPSDLDQGKGIRILGGHAKLNRVNLDGNYFGGLACDGPPEAIMTSVEVTHSVIQNTLPSPEGARLSGIQGYGINAWRCDLSVEKTLVTDNHYYGIAMMNEHAEATIVTIEDTIVRNTKAVNALRTSDKFPWANTELGLGLFFWGGEAYVNRVLLENNASAGIVTMESAYPCNVTTMGTCESTFAVLENVDIRDTQMDTTGHFGVGIAVMDGAETLISKAKIEKAHYAGILAIDALRRNGSGDTMTLMSDVQIGKISASDSADETAEGETFGDGIVLAQGAIASVSRFKVSEVERVGVLLNGKADWQSIEDAFGKRDLVSKAVVELSKTDKKGKRDSVLSFGSVEKAKVGINNQMATDDLGKRDSVEEVSSDVSTSETESSYSTDAMAIPTFSVLNKEFMEAVFGASLDQQAQ